MYCIFILVLLVVGWPFIWLIKSQKHVTKYANILAHFYWEVFPWMLEKWAGYDIYFSGDEIPNYESALVISNHRSFCDWSFVFCLAFRKGMLGCCNFFAKDSIKYVPGFGWGIWLKGSVMLKRKWADDEENIKQTFQKIHDYKLPFWLISHPEGHRLTKKYLEESTTWGTKHDLPPLKQVLYPRTKGFVESVRGLRGSPINAVYDLTIMYEDNKLPSLYDLACGANRQKVHIHVRRFTFDQLPQDRKGLADWLIKLYQEKDELLEKAFKEKGFPGERKLPYVKLPLKQ